MMAIPLEAATAPLGLLAEIRPSNVDKKSKDGEVDVRLCNYTDVYHGDRIWDSNGFMQATATPGQISRFRLLEGDVLVTKDSESPDDIGVPAMVAADLPGTILGYHTSLIRPNPSMLEPRYLYWALRSRTIRSYFEVQARGITRFALRTQDVARTPIPLPGLEEQRRIADMLDHETARIDTLITKNDVARGLADERRSELIASAVTNGIRPAGVKTSGLPWASKINTDWTVAPLIAITRTGTGHTPRRSEDSYWIDCDIPWLTTSDVHRLRSGRIERLHDTKENISRVGLDNSAAVLHPAGTVALSRTASVGFSAIMGVDMATSQDFFTWTCGSELRPAFLLYVLRAMKWRGFFDQLMYGSTHKTIYVPDLMSIRTPLPPVEEQDEIVEHIRWESNRIESLDQCLILQSQHLHERREALITAAVTGAIDV